jgi:hypothetical protein
MAERLTNANMQIVLVWTKSVIELIRRYLDEVIARSKAAIREVLVYNDVITRVDDELARSRQKVVDRMRRDVGAERWQDRRKVAPDLAPDSIPW